VPASLPKLPKTANPYGWNLYVIKVEVIGSLFESAAVAVSVKGMGLTSDVDGCPLTSVKASAILLVTVTVSPPVVRPAVSSREVLVPFPHEKRLSKARNPNSVLKRKNVTLSYTHGSYCNGKFTLTVQLEPQSC
jgi:hypothetical protein